MLRKESVLGVAAAMAVATLTMVTVAFAAQNEGGQEKVTLCHKGHSITVAAPAVAAHERHGDTMDACPTDPETTTPETTTPETTTPETTTPETTTPETTTPETTAPETTIPETTTPETTIPETTIPETTTPETTTPDEQQGTGQEKVTLCHKGHTITVAAPAQAAHLNHEDSEGACPTEAPDGADEGDETADDATNGSQVGTDIYGDSAANRLIGTPHENFLQGGRGPDSMFGGLGNDYIDGVDGIAGNDILDGGKGMDRCVGDRGDTFKYCDGNMVQVPASTDGLAQTR